MDARKVTEYRRLVAALTAGTELRFGASRHRTPTEMTPAQLRAGLNALMAEHAALVDTLLARGNFTFETYLDAVLVRLRAEVAERERQLGAKLL